MSTPLNELSPLEALKAGFRRACVRRLVGDEEGAIQVLKNEIPSLVVSWSKMSNLEPSEKKAKLKEMFDDESGRADELATAFDLFAGRFETRIATLLHKELSGIVSQVKSLLHESTTVSSSKKGNKEVEKIAQEEPISLEKGPSLVQNEPVKDEILDPPKGMGLKFDEIEKMIDQVLSFDP